MCGIAGYLSTRGPTDDTAAILRMSRLMAHRGPDDEGFMLVQPSTSGGGAGGCINLHSSDTAADARAGSYDIHTIGAVPHTIALAQRRFSIVDLSAAGHQPLWSADGNVCVAFNGEVYNHVELRRELESLGFRGRGHSDTEVLVAAYQQWGEGCFERFIGFWALALYDRPRRKLLLARDRLGKAPLYHTLHDGRFLFASEIKPLIAPGSRQVVNEAALGDYALFGRRDFGGETFFQDITSLPPATIATVNPDGSLTRRTFWQLPTQRMSEKQMPADEAVASFRDTLRSAVEVRLRADVPVGVELSGGLDSSTMVALVAQRGQPLRAFTASFEGADEAPFARRVVEHMAPGSVELETVTPTGDSFWDQADRYIDLMHEPIHAVNTFTYHQVWQAMAKRGLRVSISGAAADEVLAGYHRDYYTPYLRHLIATRQWRRLHRECVRLSEKPVTPFSAAYFKRLLHAAHPAAVADDARSLAVSSPGSAIHRLDRALCPLQLPGAGVRVMPDFDVDGLLHANMGDWRLNHWLRVGHQSAMGVPLEVRMPFLDHRVVELAFSMPLSYLIRDGWMKWVMRQAMHGQLPDDITWRARKWGFRFPFTEWLLASEERFWSIASGVDCPYVNSAHLRRVYRELATVNPLILWRTMNIVLWWKRCVMGERLS